MDLIKLAAANCIGVITESVGILANVTGICVNLQVVDSNVLGRNL